MIGKLKGIIESISEEDAVIDVNGVGYLIHAGTRTLSRLNVGQPTELHIETYVREDQLKLFGFVEERDRAWFVRLQSVQGVGAKHALSMLDSVSASEVENAAALGDVSTFERAKGVGKKLAQRIATELKDKAPPIGRHLSTNISGLNTPAGMSEPGADDKSQTGSDNEVIARRSAISALINLGYAEGDARRAVADVISTLGETVTESDLIKGALQELAL